ncbi:MAG: hypothetical protein H9917_10255 [Candidatus Oceanisphaera merdipullorum]|nr:hypothetical protein [Candidatus Oceanisphaera merdipullorum]
MDLRLGITPVHYCTGAGSDIINGRMETFERIDAAGTQSDQLTLTVNVEGISGYPEEGAVLTWFEGYKETEVLRIGSFKITRITPRLFPRQLTIVATSAPFTAEDKTGFKERRTRSWDGITFGDLFREVVAPHQLSSRVDPELDGVVMGHVDQTDETDTAFLSRLSAEHDAVAKPMDGMYILALKGRANTISGKTMTPWVISVPADNKPGKSCFVNCELDQPSRKATGGVIAQWQDDSTGAMHEVKSGTPPYRKLPTKFVNKEHAEQALKGTSRKAKREKRRLNLDIPGDPNLAAETPITLDDSFPNGMAGKMSIDRVVARGSRSGGYRMTITATSPV